MAFNAGAVKGTLELDAKAFLKAMGRVNKSLDKIEKNAKQSGKALSGFKNRLGTLRDAVIVLPAAFRALSAPFRMFREGLTSVAEAFGDIQQKQTELSVALAGAGVANVEAMTQKFVDQAVAIQNLTKFSDNEVIAVQTLLTNMGVGVDQLEEWTEATLNMAVATGKSAVESSRQLAKTLGGLTGELGEVLPQIRELTAEQLKSGEAAKLINKIYSGFAEKTAKTVEGAGKRMVNLFGGLKEAIGEKLGPTFVEAGNKIADLLQKATDAVNENGDAIAKNFKVMAGSVVGVFTSLAEAALWVSEVIFDIGQASGRVLPALLGTWMELEDVMIGVGRAYAKYAEFVTFGATSDFWTNEIRKIDEVRKRHRDAIGDVAAQYKELTDEQERHEASADATRAALGAIVDDVDALAAGWRGAADASADVADNSKKTADSTAAARDNIGAMKTRLEELRARMGEAGEAGQALGDGMERAAASGGKTVSDSAQIATNLGKAATSANQIAAAGGHAARQAGHDESFAGFTPSAGDSRSKGGSAGFDLSSIGGLKQGIQAANFAAAASTDKRARQNAAHLGRQFRAKLSAVYEEQAAAFTKGLVEELNRAGIFDPAQRQQMIQQQLDEARRLGVIQQSGTGGFFR